MIRPLADTDVLANTNLNSLIRQRTGQRRGLLHSGELLCGVDVERGRVYGFAVADIAYDFEQTELETVAALCADAEVGKDEETGVFVVVLGVFKVVQ